MGLFSSHSDTPAQTQTAPPPARHGTTSTTNSAPKRSLFGSRRSHDTSSPEDVHRASTTSTRASTSSKPSVLQRLGGSKEDPSITGARQRVLQAEQAERDADRALIEARTAVQAAREHVKRLEAEAAEEARLAKIKQNQAQDISKRGAALGREYSLFHILTYIPLIARQVMASEKRALIAIRCECTARSKDLHSRVRESINWPAYGISSLMTAWCFGAFDILKR